MTKLPYIEKTIAAIENGYISKNKSDMFDLWILKYTKKCVFDKAWDEATLFCRGVIVDADWNMYARPFTKFFNYEEIEDKSIIPDCGYKIYDKLDGCLGILYWGPDGLPYISTCGSMNSEQGKHATSVLRTKYSDAIPKLDKSKTYLFEVIYPEELHIVTYKDVDDIFLIGVIDIATGEETDIYEYENMFKCAKCYDGYDVKNIRKMFSGENMEGFVVRYDNGFRMKLKFENWFALNALKSHLSPKSILQMVIDGNDLDYETAIAMFDEEHKIYYDNIKKKYLDIYNNIKISAEVDIDLSMGMASLPLNKEKAEFIMKNCKYPSVVFAMVRGKNYEGIIWDLVKDWYKENMVVRYENDDE